ESARIQFLGDGAQQPQGVDLAKNGRLFEGQVPGGLIPSGKVELSVKFLGNVPRLALVLCVGEKDASESLPQLIPTGLTMSPPGAEALVARERARLEVPRRFVNNSEYQSYKKQAADIDKELYEQRRAALESEAAVRMFFLELDRKSDAGVADPAWKEQMR